MPETPSPGRYCFEFTPYVGIQRRRTFLGAKLSIMIGYEHRTLENGVTHPPVVMIHERLSLPEGMLVLNQLVRRARHFAERALHEHPQDSIVSAHINPEEKITWDDPPTWWANRE
jgi:hypothetical protein